MLCTCYGKHDGVQILLMVIVICKENVRKEKGKQTAAKKLHVVSFTIFSCVGEEYKFSMSSKKEKKKNMQKELFNPDVHLVSSHLPPYGYTLIFRIIYS